MYLAPCVLNMSICQPFLKLNTAGCPGGGNGRLKGVSSSLSS